RKLWLAVVIEIETDHANDLDQVIKAEGLATNIADIASCLSDLLHIHKELLLELPCHHQRDIQEFSKVTLDLSPPNDVIVNGHFATGFKERVIYRFWTSNISHGACMNHWMGEHLPE